MSTVKTITSAELIAYLALRGRGLRCKVSESFHEDAVYALPTAHYLCTVFLPGFKEWQKREGIFGKWSRSFDCDKFSDAAMYYKARCYENTADTTADGFAVHKISYITDAGTGHKVNEALTDEGLLIFEPQTCEVVSLSEQELDSIYFRNK